MGIEVVGNFMAASFGDQASIGFFFGLLEDTTQGDIYAAIKDDRPLILELLLGRKVDNVTDAEWAEYRKGFNMANIDLSYERMIKEFKAHRLDLLGVILNQPKGRKWLETQVRTIKEKLGS